MSSENTLRNIAKVSCVGLSEKYTEIIKGLLYISKALRGNFEFCSSGSLTSADILFVNVDDAVAFDYYEKRREQLSCVPVFIFMNRTTADSPTHRFRDPQYKNAISLTVPISRAKLNAILLSIISTQKTKKRPQSSPREHVKPFNILVVDDSFPVRKFMDVRLPQLIEGFPGEHNYHIDFAVSGKDAVDKVRAARGAYDIIFLDVMMDDVDGYKVCKWIKKVKRSINVVMLTSRSSPFDKVRGNLAGCDSYLSKPPNDNELKKVLMKYGNFGTQRYLNKTLER